ncbi:5'/3'-nucleotidase SurE [Haliangium ochraceum]|nr:5'/3'-nucleotidase SurE [Haliangium ochraceum]
MKPLVLLSNDDGIGSPYLQALADALDATGEVETLVVAPERQRSAASHAITLHKPLRLHKHGERRFSLSGTPVDCVYVGLIKLAERAPALVLSGINRGYNLGLDVFYSGTVAAAVEGGLRGVPAIALSLAPEERADLQSALRFSVALALQVVANPLPPLTVLNVNFPVQPDERWAWTGLGKRAYEDDVHERFDPRGQPYYWIGGGSAELGDDRCTDCAAIGAGITTVTPLRLNLSGHGLLGADAASEHGWSPAGYRLVPEASQVPEAPKVRSDGAE